LIFTVPACPDPLEEQITRGPRDCAIIKQQSIEIKKIVSTNNLKNFVIFLKLFFKEYISQADLFDRFDFKIFGNKFTFN